MRKIQLKELRKVARPARGKIFKIYLHWTAGNYHQFFEDYHLNIDKDGEIVLMHEDLTKVIAHTWHRNTGAIGIALCCAVGAVANNGLDTDFGKQPPTGAQIESLSRVLAILADVLAIEINTQTILTHCEAASLDGYGPFSGDAQTRWDLWFLKDYDNKMKPGGDVLRGKAFWYQKLFKDYGVNNACF
jgi:hypothetical protein